MKKKSFGLAAAVAVLIVLGGSYALLANHNRIQESESAAAESETGVAVATIASDKVSSFQLADGDTSFTLTKTDNSWICVQDETFPLSNDAASELVNTFTSLQAVRDLGTAQDGEDYGFSENAPTVTLTSSDSTNCSFVLGEANSMTGDYYLKREDSGEIYTVSSSLADSFHKTLTDLAEIESFPTISSDNVQELSITEEGTTLLFESSTTGSVKTWQISQSQDGGKTESTPEKATVNTVTTLVDHLGNLSFDSFVDHKEGWMGEFPQTTEAKLQKIYEDIKLPKRATAGSAGYDFYTPETFSLKSGETIKIPTGIRVEMEEGWVLKLYPRSGLGFKYRLQLDNSVGIIDSDYFYSDNEGHMFAKITNDAKQEKTLTVEKGQGFMQGIFVEYGITVDDDATAVRNGGFGSTTK